MGDTSPPWNDQQWQTLRSVVQEAARKARVASTFLPVSGAPSDDDATVPSLWTKERDNSPGHPGVAPKRLEARSGKALHLITISTNVFLRGADVSDPDLQTVKSLLRRSAEVLARLEDAIIFYGLPEDETEQEAIFARVQPEIYTVSGGSDFTGLLQTPETFLDTIRVAVSTAPQEYTEAPVKTPAPQPPSQLENLRAARLGSKSATGAARTPFQDVISAIEESDDFMAVETTNKGNDIITAVIEAVGKLNRRRSGPYAAVFGHDLFKSVNTPSTNLVLPSTAIMSFLEGGPLLRSGVLPKDAGLVVALGGDPIELVLGSDMDVRFVQVTLDTRYVLRVFERLVLRIKELDAVCKIVLNAAAGGRTPAIDENFVVRKASK